MTDTQKKTARVRVALVVVIAVVLVAIIYFWEKSTERPLVSVAFSTKVQGDLQQCLQITDIDILPSYESSGSLWGSADIKYVGPAGYELSGVKVCAYVTSAGTNALNVKIEVYSGILLYPPGTLTYYSVDLPTMSQNNSTYHFSFNFYPVPSPSSS